MISNTKRLEVSICMYANVSGQFALFCNPKYRGSSFTWEWFVEHCESNADLWVLVADIKGNRIEINQLARRLAKEISQNLIGKLK